MPEDALNTGVFRHTLCRYANGFVLTIGAAVSKVTNGVEGGVISAVHQLDSPALWHRGLCSFVLDAQRRDKYK